MRTVWKGTLSFGLVSVPVGLVVAQGRPTLGLRRVARATGAPVRHRRWDPVAERELAQADTVAALELAPGRYARLEPEELRALRAGEEPPASAPTSTVPADVAGAGPARAPEPEPELESEPGDEDPEPDPEPELGPPDAADEELPRSAGRRPPEPGTIAVEGFVPVEEVAPELYDRAYWLAPEPAGRRPYRLLLQALADAGQAAICRVALRDREHLALVRAGEGLLVLHTLHWPEDVRRRDRERIAAGVAETPLSEGELDLARRLISHLEKGFDPDEHRDDARARIAAYLSRKGAGEGPPPAEPAPAPDPAGDLMAALRASLAAAGGAAEDGRDGAARRAS